MCGTSRRLLFPRAAHSRAKAHSPKTARRRYFLCCVVRRTWVFCWYLLSVVLPLRLLNRRKLQIRRNVSSKIIPTQAVLIRAPFGHLRTRMTHCSSWLIRRSRRLRQRARLTDMSAIYSALVVLGWNVFLRQLVLFACSLSCVATLDTPRTHTPHTKLSKQPRAEPTPADKKRASHASTS